MEFEEYINKISGRFRYIESLFKKKKLTISYDKLKIQTGTDNELLYFKTNGSKERTGIFIFGFWFFTNELNEQEFKRKLGLNGLNMKIIRAYKELKKEQKVIKVSDLLNFIQNRRKDSVEIHRILRRVLTLSYYLNWNLQKDSKDIEGDYSIIIPDKFLGRVKQRYNFDNVASVYENKDLFIFINSRGKLNLVFKEMDLFTRKEIEKLVVPVFKKIFLIEEIKIE